MLMRRPIGRRFSKRAKGLAVTVLVLASATAAGYAFADPVKICNPRTGICVGDVETPGTDPGGGNGGGGDYTCVPDLGCHSGDNPCYYKWAQPQPDPSDPRWAGHTGGGFYVKTCVYVGDDYMAGLSELVWFDNPPSGPSPAVLAARAVSQMQLRGPAIGSAPSSTGSGLVGLPVWLWTEAGPQHWGPISMTASVPGLSITATAQASKIDWDMGDGNTVTCTNPGTPYEARFGNSASSSCGYRYTRSSRNQPAGRYTITGTTTWHVEWSGGGVSGTQTLTLASTTTLQINELQVVTS